MENYKLPERKRDLLDELNDLRHRRGIAYRKGNTLELEAIHQEMKAFWLRNGWSEDEAQEEYVSQVKECVDGFKIPQGNPAISHIVFAGQSGEILHLKSIAELSRYWLTQNITI